MINSTRSSWKEASSVISPSSTPSCSVRTSFTRSKTSSRDAAMSPHVGVGVVEGADSNTVLPSRCASRPTTSWSTPRAARRTALAIARREEFPCAITARPRRPSRYAPPYVSGSSRFRSRRAAGRISRPPSLPRVVAVISWRNASSRFAIVPSRSLSVTLPVKPSVTTTSAAPRSRSRPSVLPPKLRSLAASSACASSVNWLPFSASSPIESRRTSGLRTSRISSAKTAPMCANWSRSLGRASAFAPESMRTDGPRRDGIVTAIAGRRTPRTRRSSSRHAASIAPVLPAETTARASPSPTARHAATRELFGLARTASVGFSSMAMTSGASISSRPCVSSSFGPTTTGETASDAAASAPATISSGPRSPPMASTATRIMRLGDRSAERLDVAAAVRVARRTDPVRTLGTAALRADVQARRLDLVLRATLIAACLRGFFLGDGHGTAECSGRPLRRVRGRRLQLFAQALERRPAGFCRLLLVRVRLRVEILPADGTETGAVRAAEDLVRQGEGDGVARPGGEVEVCVAEIRRPKLVRALRIGRLVLAGGDRDLEHCVVETAVAGTVHPTGKSELEDRPGAGLRDHQLGRDLFRDGDVALTAQLDRIELELDLVAIILA